MTTNYDIQWHDASDQYPPEARIDEAQAIQFALMRVGSFNNFDGERVVESLVENRDLWAGVVFGRYAPGLSWAIILRDIQDDCYNADELRILAVPGKDRELKLLAESWDADEIDWQTAPHVGKHPRVWWD